MKKPLLTVFTFLFSVFIYTQDLNGVWESENKIISFSNAEAQFVFKLFYGWYYDKEVSFSSEIDGSEGIISLQLYYPKFRQTQVYPLGIIETDLFLDYYIRGSAFSDTEKSIPSETDQQKNLYGFWRCAGNMYDISIDEPRFKDEVYSYYFTDSHVYKIRYWISEVPYQEVSVSIYDENVTLNADKYLQIGDQVYTCVTGRGVSVRNVEKIPYEVFENNLTLFMPTKTDYVLYLAANEQLMSFSTPYMSKAHISNLEELILQKNARRAFPQ